MPYIKQDRRPLVETQGPVSAGDLNYIITMIIQDFLDSDPTYSDFNEVMGALECCKLELYRRMVVPYEDKKIEENGDVYYVEQRETLASSSQLHREGVEL